MAKTREQIAAYKKAWAEKNKEKLAIYFKALYAKNRVGILAAKLVRDKARAAEKRAANPVQMLSGAESKRAAQARYYAKHKERIAAYQKEWYAKNREKSLAGSAARQMANPEQSAARQAAYRKRNPEKVKAYKVANGKRQAAEYRKKHGEELKDRMRKWQSDNKEHSANIHRQYYEKHKDVVVERARAWAKNNPAKTALTRLVQCARRRATKFNATPGWANAFFISEIYDLARRRNKLMTCGVKWHVDHIVPLRGKNVCGLHVENNLQVIPAIDNIKKSNKHVTDITERI